MLKAAVVIDYQNIHLTAHDNYAATGTGKHETLISPLRFAETLVEQRNARQRSGYPHAELARVEAYRGQPSLEHEPDRHAITQREQSRWTKDDRVLVHYRPLKYYFNDWGTVREVQEKGVDVLCALALIRLAAQECYDLVILASHDSDLEPALDMAAGMGGARIETAGWGRGQRYTRRLRCDAANLWHTFLDETAFGRARDPEAMNTVAVRPLELDSDRNDVGGSSVAYTSQSS